MVKLLHVFGLVVVPWISEHALYHSINCTVLTLNQIATFNRCTEGLSYKDVQKFSAVCLLNKEINNEQKGK